MANFETPIQLRFLVCAVIFSFATLSCQINAFAPPTIHQHIPSSYTSSSLAEGFGKNIKPSQTKSSSKQELFELQELRAQLQTITDKNMLYQSLSPDKRNELTKYVNAIIDRSDSPVDVTGKVNALGPMQFVAGIENKSWRMVFSTNNESDGSEKNNNASELPYGSTVVFRIGELNGAKGNLDYVLKFSKQIMGLKELVAKSTCEVDVSHVDCESCESSIIDPYHKLTQNWHRLDP